MKTKAILFDKDGTLIDFAAFWIPVARAAISDILHELYIKNISADEILSPMGLKKGIIDINSILCYGTYAEMTHELHTSLKKHGCTLEFEEMLNTVIASFRRNSSKGIIKPTCNNITEVLSRLKNLGIKLAVVTSDAPFTAKKCLDGLGITRFFDKIYTDDGETPVKPDPFCIYDFCDKENISKDAVVMVGDTPIDMSFAKNGKIKAIGVAKDENNAKVLSQISDIVIPDISYLLSVLE